MVPLLATYRRRAGREFVPPLGGYPGALRAGAGGARQRVLIGIAIVLALLLCAAARAPFIEADAPSWEVFAYQPLDEAYYTLGALRAHLADAETEEALRHVPEDGSAMRPLQNALSRVALAVFDHTLIGLRLPALLCALLSLLLFLGCASYVLRDAAVPRRSVDMSLVSVFGLACAIIYLFEPGLVWLGVANEPTGIRVAGAAAVLWLFLRCRENCTPRDQLLCGVAAGVAVFLVYPSNLFTLLFLLVVLPVPGVGAAALRDLFRSRALCLLGFAAVAAPVLAHRAVLESQGVLSVPVSTFADRVMLDNVLYNVAVFDAASAFRLNPLLMAATVAVVIIGTLSVLLQRARAPAAIATLFVWSFVLQSLYLSDYAARKLNFAVPFLLLAAFAHTADWLGGRAAAIEEGLRARAAAMALLLAGLTFAVLTSQPYSSSMLTHAQAHAWWFAACAVCAAIAAFTTAVLARVAAATLCIVMMASASTALRNYGELLDARSHYHRDAMEQLAAMLPPRAYVLGWGGYSLAFARGSQRPVGNMYVWAHHPRGAELLRQTVAALARTGEPVYWVGELPGSDPVYPVPGDWEQAGTLPNPLHATFAARHPAPMEVYRLRGWSRAPRCGREAGADCDENLPKP